MAFIKVISVAIACIAAVNAGLIEPQYYNTGYDHGYLDGGHYGAATYLSAPQPAPYLQPVHKYVTSIPTAPINVAQAPIHYAAAPAPAIHYKAAPAVAFAPAAPIAPITSIAAAPIGHAVPSFAGLEYATYAPHHDHEHYSYPKYAFEYGVNDPHTGDIKSQYEERDGDVVKGSYSLVEPDGTIRVVEYTADDLNGFNAVVKKIGVAHHPSPVHHVPAVAAAPIAHIASPALAAAPIPTGYGYGHLPYHHKK